ncbi:hypothetical protein Vadar_030083 [Vaccinium darrowii]|uniref:Uncharacterized protein n=1 Tax=Vaccinium darrowii TaxID=229202 RepID=A0ACB7XVX4_9ERIC|nr:hypothetical protein Vadar_030083 [Vaccinium darrowii]
MLGKKRVRTLREESHEGGSEKYPNTNRVLVSLFVDNLPEDTSHSWLKKFFNNYGVVKEVFIPAKRSKATGRRFAFVRYDCDISADVAIADAHGMTDANTSKLSSFDKGRILIAAEAKSKIDSWINVDINGVCYPIKVIEEDYFISKLLNEDGLSDSSSGYETDKEDADMDIPIEKTTNVAETMLEVGNTNFTTAMTSQSWFDVDVSSNSCVGDGFLALDDGKVMDNAEGDTVVDDLFQDDSIEDCDCD